MRTKDQILTDVNETETIEGEEREIKRAIIELLADIRDLLAKKN